MTTLPRLSLPAGSASVEASPVQLAGFDEQGRRVPMHVREFLGNGPRPVVVALPFTAAHGGQMIPFCEAMRLRGFHAVAVDLPGHGRSGGKRGCFEIEHLFRTIDVVVNHYWSRRDCSNVVLAGSSWGGDLALLFAHWEQQRDRKGLTPRRTSAVFAQAVITPWLPEAFRHFRRALGISFHRHRRGLSLAGRLIGRRLPVCRLFRPSDLYATFARRKRFLADPYVLKSYDAASYLSYLCYRPEPDELEVPLHLFIGSKDRLVPPAYERRVFRALRSRHRHSTFTVIPGASHGAFEEYTEQVADFVTFQWQLSGADQHASREETG